MKWILLLMSTFFLIYCQRPNDGLPLNRYSHYPKPSLNECKDTTDLVLCWNGMATKYAGQIVGYDILIETLPGEVLISRHSPPDHKGATIEGIERGKTYYITVAIENNFGLINPSRMEEVELLTCEELKSMYGNNPDYVDPTEVTIEW